MAIFRGVGGSGSSSDNSFLQEVTAQATTATTKANEASASATSAEASATSAANSLATIQNTEVTSASFNTGDGVLTLTKLGGATVTADLDGRFLTSYTETNDLSSAVTWVNVPNAYITAGSVTQHQAALTITESQISDLQSYLTSYTETNNLTTAVTWANVPDNFITQSSVTQHQAALSVTESQISDLQSYLTAETSHADVLVDGDFTSNGLMKRDGVGAYSVDSSTYATETYVDTAVSGLVDSAPATLDTLNELASALGDDANFSTTVTNSLAGKANLSGATFTGNVNVQDGLLSANSGANQPFFKVSTVAASGSAGVFLDGDIVVNGTVDGVDIATRDAVLTSTTTTANSALQDLVDDTTPQLGGDLDLNGNDITGTGAINIGGGYNTSTGSYVTSSGNLTTNAGNIIANSGTLTLGSDATIGGNVVVTGTVDGRDVATDGARLDTIPYHRVRDDRLSSFNQQLALTTTNQNLGQYQNLYHPNTPVETMRFVDVEWTTLWSYVSSTNNDIRLSLYLTVPSTVSAVSIGTANAFAPSSYYSVRQSNEAWYWVSGNYEHLFTEFGRVSQSSSGSIKQQVVSAMYNPDADRTYFCATNTTAPIATGDTVYFHPYAWQNANAQLLVYKDIAERYRSGFERHNVNFKLPYTDDTLIYKLNIKELSTSDSAVVRDAQVRITSTGI